jgi:murein DD-endopeptidase MepM/ murein hydrolase activator NlpD
MSYPISKNLGHYRIFGKFDSTNHLGYDFIQLLNMEIVSIDDGIVLDSREIDGFGSLVPNETKENRKGGAVFILHGNIVALYGHVNRLVKTGDKVVKGQTIGTIRDFTNIDKNKVVYHASHLHFGIWNKNTLPPPPYGYNKSIDSWIDPIGFLDSMK